MVKPELYAKDWIVVGMGACYNVLVLTIFLYMVDYWKTGGLVLPLSRVFACFEIGFWCSCAVVRPRVKPAMLEVRMDRTRMVMQARVECWDICSLRIIAFEDF